MEINFDFLIGMTVKEAEALVKYKIRAVSKNGIPTITTRDLQMDRLNVHIVDEKIKSVRGLG